MSANVIPTTSHHSDDWREQEQALEAFEAAWRAGGRPELDAHLPEGPDRRQMLIELILSDIECRHREGVQRPVEDYLGQYPELAGDGEAVLRLVETEIRVRRRSGRPRAAAEYLRLFPQHGPALRGLLETGGENDPWATVAGPGIPDDERTTAEPHGPGGNAMLITSDAARYRICEVIGAGGVGLVYRVHDHVLDRDLAMKVLRDNLKHSADAQRRLIREAQITGQLQHPNIVPVHELGRFLPPDQRIYFVMRLVPGRTFAGYLRDNPAGLSTKALDIFLKICQAVAYAHDLGVIHRDLKPSNVMVGAFGEVQVMDWGFAKLLARRRPRSEPDECPVGSGPSDIRPVTDGSTYPETHHGSVIGTPAYMSPEQANGRVDDLDGRSDVFGLGAILCEILTGTPPYSGDAALRSAAAADLADAWARLGDHPDRELAAIATRCLAAEKGGRFANAGELADEIFRYSATREERLRNERAAAEERLHKERAAAEERLHKERAAAEGRLRRERNRRRITLVAAAVAVIGVLTGLRWRAQREEFARRKQWANGELARGREFVRAGEHVSALGVLDGLTDTLRDERRLADVEARAKELRELASRELAMQQAAEAEATADRDWYVNLARRREDAFLSYSMFRDEDRKRWASHVARRSRLALEVAGYPDDDERLDRPARAGRTLSAEERKDIRASVLALLLILADVESQSVPVKNGADPDGQARGPLTTATALQGEFHTRAYGRIRDEIASRLGEKRGRTEPPKGAGVAEQVPNEYDDYLLGQIDYSHGSLDSAVSNLKLAQRNQPSRRIWTQFLLAKCFLKLGRPLEAKAELDECVRARPDLAWSYMLRGTANDQAARSAKLRAASEPWRAAAWNEEVRRLTEVADEDYREALARTDVPGERAVIHFARHTLRLLPKDPAGTAPDLDGAARDLEEARRLSDGGWIKPYISLAYVLHQLGREDQAQQSLVEAIRRFPDSPLPHRTRAGLILKKNPLALADVDRILEYLEAAIRLEKDDPRIKARDLVVKAHMLSERREFARAAEIADETLQLSKGDLAAHLCKIEALLGARRHDEAGAACRLALEAGHRSPILYEVHGLLLARRRDYPAAIEAYTSALTLDPHRTSLHLVRGWSYLAANSPRMARPDFEKALKNGDAPAEAHCGLGAACVALQLDREALDHARSALEGESSPTALTLYRVARIHAQAADLTNDVDAVRQRLDYTQRLLVAASERLPAIDQRPFWQEIDKDPSLRALHRRLGYAEWFRRSSSTIRNVAGTNFDPRATWTGHESPPVVGGPSSRLRSELRSLAEIEAMRLREIGSDP